MREEVYIVGGGPSLRNVDLTLLEHADTIVTNIAIFDVPNPNYFITIDYSFILKIARRLEEFKKSNATKVFVAGLHHVSLIEKNGRIVDTKNKIMYNLSVFDMIVKSYKEYGCGLTWNQFKSGLNSGFCALQLAVLLGYTDIYLLGMDLTGTGQQTHYHNCYGRDIKFQGKLKTYDETFRTGLDEIQSKTKVWITSCSPTSSLNDRLVYKPLEEVL